MPVYNGRRWLREALDAIEAQRDGRPFEIIAVDDGSRDGSRRILEEAVRAGHVRLIDGPGRGIAAAINAGVREARHPIICQVDQDVILAPGWLAHLLEALDDPGGRRRAGALPDRAGRRLLGPHDGSRSRAALPTNPRRRSRSRLHREHRVSRERAAPGRPSRRDARLWQRQRPQLPPHGGRASPGVLPRRPEPASVARRCRRLRAPAVRRGLRPTRSPGPAPAPRWRRRRVRRADDGARPADLCFGIAGLVVAAGRRAGRISLACHRAHLDLPAPPALQRSARSPALPHGGDRATDRRSRSAQRTSCETLPGPRRSSCGRFATCAAARPSPGNSMPRHSDTSRAAHAMSSLPPPHGCWRLVPAFNEELNLTRVVRELRRVAPDLDILVVNDGSTDGTIDLLPTLGIDWLTLPQRVGVGGAVRAGLRYAVRQGYEYVVRIDGDGQHRASDVVRMLAPVVRGRLDASIGSRFVPTMRPRPGRRLTLRRLSQAALAGCLTVWTRQRFTDPTSGFWLFGPRAVRLLGRHHPTGYAEPELVLFLCRNGLRVGEVPIRMRPRRAGRTSITPARATLAFARTILALMMVPVRKPES